MKQKAKETTIQDIYNPALANLVTPLGMEFGKNYVVIGEMVGKIYGIVRYPQKQSIGWLSKITNIPNSVVTISFQPIDNSMLISSISRSVVQQRGIVEGAKDPLTRQRAEKAAIDGERIIMQVDQEGETVGLMSITIMAQTTDESKQKKVYRQLESIVSSLKCKVRPMANLQKESFQHIVPSYPSILKIEDILHRIVPMSTFCGGFANASTGFTDGKGNYMGKDSTGGLVIVDPWMRGNDRTNSNFVIMGNSGTGKSTCIKHILMDEYMNGTKILLIDPESEVRHEVA